MLDEQGPEGGRRVVSIATALTDLMNQPGYAALDVSPESVESIVNEHMNQLHVVGKNLLGSIISEQMSKRIALTD